MIPQNNSVFKKKFRFQFSAEFPWGSLPKMTVKVVARPSLSIQEKEVDYLNAKTWIPEKQSWNKMTLIHITPEFHPDFCMSLNKALESPQDSSIWGTGFLDMLDGAGNFLESWKMKGIRPSDVQFHELDHSACERLDIEMTWCYEEVLYSSAKKITPQTDSKPQSSPSVPSDPAIESHAPCCG